MSKDITNPDENPEPKPGGSRQPPKSPRGPASGLGDYGKGPNPEVGKIYKGKVIRAVPRVGVFVEVLPGKEGLIRIPQSEAQRSGSLVDAVREGDQIEVMCIQIDEKGLIYLSGIAPLS